ncbi:TPA: ATP-binding cassette domain-containing protein [Streptococcus suis]
MIEVTDVSKAFKENIVLDSITMTASDGKITSIIGSNGAGKSTLIAII